MRLLVGFIGGAFLWGAPLALAEPLPAALSAGFNDAEITWSDLDEGLQQAQASGKPVFVLVRAPWCPVCRDYKQVFSHPSIVALSKEVVFVLIDRDARLQDSLSYAPDGNYIPRSMLLSPDGKLLAEINSGRSDFRYFLDPNDHRQLQRNLNKALR